MKKFIAWLLILSLCLYNTPAFAGNIQDTMGKKAVENIIANYDGVSTAEKFLNTNTVSFSDGDTTPSVNTGNIFLTTNTGATTVTDFEDGTDTQKLSINFGDVNTTIQHGANIVLQGAADFTGQAGDSVSFVHVNGQWREVGRSGAVPGATYKVKVSGVDTTANYLSTKLTGSNGIKYAASGAGNETLDIYLDYNTDNLKITSTELNTIQDITTTDTPTFNRLILSSAPTSGSHATTKDYVDTAIQGLDWQESVKSFLNFVTSEPVAPGTGDRHINTTTGTSSETSQSVTANYIYEWNGASWTETAVVEGEAVWNEDDNVLYVFNGSDWVRFGATMSHNLTTGKQGGTVDEYYHLTSTEYGGNWGVKSLQSTGTLQIGNTTIGSGVADTDYTLTFNGEDNDGVFTFMEDENRLDFDSDFKVTGTINGTTDVQVNGVSVLTSEVDGDVTNEINTITADDAGTTAGLAITLAGAGISTTSRSGDTITVTSTEVDGSTTNEINTITADDAGTTTGLGITIAGGGINATTRSGDTITVTGTEVDGSTSNEINTITADDAGTTSGLAITLAGAGIAETSSLGDTITVTATEVDGSTTNEINTITADDAGTTSGLAITVAGGGINTTTRSGDTITVTGTEVDGSTSNEINTITADDAGTTNGLAITIAGGGINATTRSGDTITVTGTEVDGSTTNEINTITADDAGTTSGLAVTLAGAGISTTSRSGDTITVTSTEADTLATVTGRGASTTTSLTIGSSTIGEGAAGVDYTLTFDGDDADGVVTFDEDLAKFIFDQDAQVTGTINGTVDVQVNGTSVLTTDAVLDSLNNVAAMSEANGDILYYNSDWKNLAKASDGDILTLASGLPSWYTPATKAFSFTIAKPLDLDESDTFPVWVNRTGKTFTISAIYSNSDTDDTAFTLKEVNDHTDFTDLTTIEAITINTDGTGVYYNDLTSGIDHTVIETTHLIVFDNDAADDPDYVNVTVVGSLS